jgi:hypothetical protein
MRRSLPASGLVKLTTGALLFGWASLACAAQQRAPLYDSVTLNIGINCRWERRCISVQQRAMHRALDYVRTRRLAPARIHLCNRNASRGRYRVDWVGFDNCIRNGRLGAYGGR